ncbi:MAG: hypothetical protein RBR15_10850 [Sphaerochaeta sp.]|nr:hypothetical protein [Sphaerochaeta sp.]
MNMCKRVLTFGAVAMLLLMVAGCSLFGPSLQGKTHVAKAISGAQQIQATKEGKGVNEKLVELFNAEIVLAYQQTEQSIAAAQADVSLYVGMPYADYAKLATEYEAVKAKYGMLITSAVDYTSLVKDLDKKAGKALFEAAMQASKTSDDYEKLTGAASYLKKAIELNNAYEAEGKEVLISIYIRLGDIKAASSKLSDVEAATSYYAKALTLDRTNKEAIDKLAVAEEKLIMAKVVSIQDALKNGKTYKEFNEALRSYGSLGSAVGAKYGYLEAELEKKLTADILVCVGPGSGITFTSPQETTPSWPLNVKDKNPKTIKVEYEYFPTLNIKVPTSHTYVLVPDADFGKVALDYDSKMSNEITVDSTANALERSLRETQLKQDPNNMEARNALATGTYKKVTVTLKQTANNIYHVYKIENGKPRLLASTNASVYTKTFDQIKFISGSKAPIELKTGMTFNKGDMGGDEFEYNQQSSYFTKHTLTTLYGRALKNNIGGFYELLW